RRRMNSAIEVSGYDLPTGFHGSRRRQSPTHQREMISNRPLAQNEKRKSKDDACRDDGAELGKHRPDAAGSKFRRLAPCSRTKIVLLDSRPPPAPKGGQPIQGNNSPVTKRPV